MNSVVEKIRRHGYWEVKIHPAQFDRLRIPNLLSLEGIVRTAAVQIRGWDFPHFGREPARLGLDSIELDIDWSDHIEFWRFHQSALFFHTMAIRSDWAHSSLFSRREQPWQPGSALLVIDTLYHFVEIFEFVARLASGNTVAPSWVVEVTLSGLEGRQLLLDSPNRADFSSPRTASIPSFPQSMTLSAEDAIGRARQHAYSACRNLYMRFGWEPTDELFEGMVDELRRSGFKV